MKEIQLTQGKVALVDDEDFEYLNQWKWCCRKNVTKGSINYYAGRSGGSVLKYRYIHMHKVILKTDKLVDHKNRNGLDNRKDNLRIASKSDNSKNKKGWGKSKYLGVSLNVAKRKTKPSCERWVATIFINGKNKNLGRFKTEKEAALKYDEVAKVIHGEFANLNFKSL
jgi:hypothetical protein